MQKNNTFGIIYKVSNIINNMTYIGQTVGTLDSRKIKHKSLHNKKHPTAYLHKAMKKYGWESFVWEVLEYCDSKEELDEMEFHYIIQYNTIIPNGYNMTSGGEGTLGRICKEETKLKISSSKKGKALSEEHKKLLSDMRRGKPKSKNHILNVADAKSKYWEIIFPSGDIIIIKNLSKFCRENSLSDRGMWLVANNKRTHHKGFKCKKL